MSNTKLVRDCIDEIEDVLQRYIYAGASIPSLRNHLIGLAHRIDDPEFKKKPDPLKILIARSA